MPAKLQTMRMGGASHPEEIVNLYPSSVIESSGVSDKDAEDFLVEQSDTPAMSVKVNMGRAHLRVTDGSMVYPVRLSEEAATVSIDPNNSGNSRIDAIILYIDLGVSANSDISNVALLSSIEGTPAGSPTAPTDAAIQSEIGASNPFIRIADVTVANGASSILNASIADKRINTVIGSPRIDGWTPSQYRWVYASASSFTVTGIDVTSIYRTGTKLRWKQGGSYKYGYVASSSFSTNTTVNIAVNTDYTIANSVITDMDYSYESSPQGFPDFFNYTIVFVGFSADPTNNCARYKINGRSVILIINSDSDGTSNANNFTISAPITAATVSNAVWRARCGFASDNGSPTNLAVAALSSGSATISLSLNNLSTGWTTSNGKRACFTLIYEI